MPALNINGKTMNADVPDDTPLLWTLRDVLSMTGTKFGRSPNGRAIAALVHCWGLRATQCVS